jgi:hypothetical protein
VIDPFGAEGTELSRMLGKLRMSRTPYELPRKWVRTESLTKPAIRLFVSGIANCSGRRFEKDGSGARMIVLRTLSPRRLTRQVMRHPL